MSQLVKFCLLIIHNKLPRIIFILSLQFPSVFAFSILINFIQNLTLILISVFAKFASFCQYFEKEFGFIFSHRVDDFFFSNCEFGPVLMSILIFIILLTNIFITGLPLKKLQKYILNSFWNLIFFSLTYALDM